MPCKMCVVNRGPFNDLLKGGKNLAHKMASIPVSGSSTGLERKFPEKVRVQESVPADFEYERYPILHEQFGGDGKKKLSRKHKSQCPLVQALLTDVRWIRDFCRRYRFCT